MKHTIESIIKNCGGSKAISENTEIKQDSVRKSEDFCVFFSSKTVLGMLLGAFFLLIEH